MVSPPKNLKLDDQLCFALYAATNTITRAYRPLLEQIGLTYPQYLVMMVLWQEGQCSVGEIASRLALPPHAASPIVDRLAVAGLVERRRRRPDLRVVHVTVTPTGSDLRHAASAIQRNVVHRTKLNPAGLARVRHQLHSLVERMSQQQEHLPVTPSQDLAVTFPSPSRSTRPLTHQGEES
jgi:DNA-binding MarR family transcriptional regulator